MNGISVLSKTGDLLFTMSGFRDGNKGQYTYPSGVSGFGNWLEEDAYLVMSASDINNPLKGEAAFFLVDISQRSSFYPS